MTIDVVLEPKIKDVGGFAIRRALPQVQRRAVGPFVFFDHLGPADVPPGKGMDVRPHPHIALATITYLFDGEIFHRDSIGSARAIRPGDVNWMVAGRGIVHSERTPPETRARGQRMHFLQTWVALPEADEETDPRFEHHPAATLPARDRDGVALRVIAGTAYGMRAPTGVLSPTLYAHAKLEAGASLDVDDEHEERAVYVIDGRVTIGDTTIDGTRLVVLVNGARAAVRAETAANVVLLGGAPLGPRHIWWNFVASSKERIERAKSDWREGRFPKVPGDEQELIPLPE